MPRASRPRWERFSRRDLLKAAGSTLLIPRFLGRALAATPRGPRLVLLMQTNGTNQAAFWPNAAFSSPILDPILKNASLRQKTTVIKGLFNDNTGGNGHDDGFASLYSGYRTTDLTIPNGPSVDQILKRQLSLSEPFPVVNTAVLAHGERVGRKHRLSFVCAGRGQNLPAQTDPYQLYATTFADVRIPGMGGDAAAKEAAEQRLRERRSVLDYVAKDLTSLSGRLGTAERAKLDLHTTALRAFEGRLSAGFTAAPASCAPPKPGTGAPLDLKNEHNIPMLVDLLFDFIAAALSCNLTRIATFQFGPGGNHWRYSWLGLNKDTHDDVAHLDNGKNPAATAEFIRMNVWHAQKVGSLAERLDGVAEGGGTALDNTLVVWGNELATGPHGTNGIPLVFLGKAAGRLKKTGFLVDAGPQTHHRLGATLLTLMGHPVKGFGEQPDCGLLSGVSL
jgi:hypothetical protein